MEQIIKEATHIQGNTKLALMSLLPILCVCQNVDYFKLVLLLAFHFNGLFTLADTETN